MSEKINMLNMSTYKIIISRRSIRRFQQKPIKISNLKKFVNAARLAPSAANLQIVKYFIVTDKNLCAKIFKTIGWAGYLKPTWIPKKEERPTAYILLLITDTDNKYYLRDVSFSTENIVIAAEAENIGSCILCNIKKDEIRKILNIPDELYIDSIIALGYKSEKPIIEEYKDSIKYWRDSKEILHVPKRKLQNIIHINKI